jgi:hypothetical protein
MKGLNELNDAAIVKFVETGRFNEVVAVLANSDQREDRDNRKSDRGKPLTPPALVYMTPRRSNVKESVVAILSV